MLSVKNLKKSYKEKIVVNDLSFDIEEGDIYGLIGHNGAGKTTTIKAIVGIINFDNGEITINGKSIINEPIECKSIMAYIPDNPILNDGYTGLQYLNFVSDIYKVKKKDRIERIEKYCEEFELTAMVGELISTYSHGTKQKLAIISALIHNPKLLVLDEPFVGLDPMASFKLKAIMKTFCEDGGAILITTHVLDVAEKLCNKIAIIKDGELIVKGDTNTLIKDNSLEDLFIEINTNEL